MKALIASAVLLLPFAVGAEHMDVIQVKLKPKCTVEKYVALKDEFNETWGKDHGYRAEVVVPLQNQDLVSVFWVGRSADAAAFGAAWDAWRDAQADDKSVAAKLQERFDDCSDNESRSSFDVY